MDKLKAYFKNREDALNQLIQEIEGLDLKDTFVLSISQDGSLLARGVAQHFGLPFEYFFLSAIKAPQNPDCVIAIVSEKMDVVVDEDLVSSFDIPIDWVFEQARRQYDQLILPQAQKIRGESPILDFEEKNILIVDEGVETGFSIELAIRGCINGKCKSVSVGIPVLSRDLEQYLLQQCDCLYRVLNPEHFVSTNYFYKDLPTLEDDGSLCQKRYFF